MMMMTTTMMAATNAFLFGTSKSLNFPIQVCVSESLIQIHYVFIEIHPSTEKQERKGRNNDDVQVIPNHSNSRRHE